MLTQNSASETPTVVGCSFRASECWSNYVKMSQGCLTVFFNSDIYVCQKQKRRAVFLQLPFGEFIFLKLFSPNIISATKSAEVKLRDNTNHQGSKCVGIFFFFFAIL